MEKLAFQIIGLPVLSQVAIAYVSAITGALLAARIARGNGQLPRIPFFAFFSLIFFVQSLAALSVFAIPFAMIGGFMIVVLGFYLIAVPLIAGIFLGLIAMARSRDAFDHPYGAILAFVPLAIFYLLFARNKEVVHDRQVRTPRVFRGFAGIAVGLACLAAGFAVTRDLPNRVERLTVAVLSHESMQLPAFEAVLHGQGLARTMDAIIEETPLPMPVEDGRILIDVQRRGARLTYTYSVVSDDGASVALWQNGLVLGNCTDAHMRLLIDAGATIEHVFLSRSDGYEDGRVAVDRAVCDT